MTGLTAICPKCGEHSNGWALSNQRHQFCRHCGCGLEIYKDEIFMGYGYSPLTAPPYFLGRDQIADLVAGESGGRTGSEPLDLTKELTELTPIIPG
jgi:hypothetical protein